MSELPKWDQRFATAAAPGPVTAVVASGQEWLPATGRALDLACGISGNGLFLASQGLQSELWDSSAVALGKQALWAREKQLKIDTQLRDCGAQPPPPNSFDVICVAHFLYRPICSALAGALRPGGTLFYQTFTVAGSRRHSGGPSNADFLLKEGELPALFSALEVCYYCEDFDGRAQLIARRGERGR